MIVLLFGMNYLTMIRPQRKKQKEYEKLMNELTRGDKIVTTGGWYGVITHVESDYVIVELEPAKVRLKLNRASIYQVVEWGEEHNAVKIVLDENNNFVKTNAVEDTDYDESQDVYVNPDAPEETAEDSDNE